MFIHTLGNYEFRILNFKLVYNLSLGIMLTVGIMLNLLINQAASFTIKP